MGIANLESRSLDSSQVSFVSESEIAQILAYARRYAMNQVCPCWLTRHFCTSVNPNSRIDGVDGPQHSRLTEKCPITAVRVVLFVVASLRLVLIIIRRDGDWRGRKRQPMHTLESCSNGCDNTSIEID